MIIDFEVLIKDYKENILNCYNMAKITCPKCGAKGRFHRHGFYVRNITHLSDDSSIIFEPIEILRIKCTSCHSTHSILPGDCIPFQVYSLPVVLFLCEQIIIKKNSIRNTVQKTKCAIQTIYKKIKTLKQSLILIEFFFRQINLYTVTSSMSLKEALSLLLLPTMKFSSYLHCHGHPIFLNRRITKPYPFYFAMVVSFFSNPT